MFHVKFDTKQLKRVFDDTAKYSKGFVDGVELNKIKFMIELGQFVEEALNKYIDLQARINPDSLHHVYEWGQAGSPGARLFEIESIPGPNVIRFSGRFLASSSISDNATEPFVYKAETMENGIGITITPKFSDYLAFEIGGRTVFTMDSIYVAHPGGDAVAGSFGKAVDVFFSQYLTNTLLQPFLRDLATAEEYVRYFPQGAKGGGYGVGIKAGRLYLSSAGVRAI